MTVLLGGADEMFLDRPQDSSVLADVEVLFENILRCCFKDDEMPPGKREKSPKEPLMESIYVGDDVSLQALGCLGGSLALPSCWC